MMHFVKNLFLVLLLGGCPSNWRKQDTVMESVALTFTVIDMKQTKQITANCSEANPILGECGQNVDYRVYFASVILVEMVVARLLSESLRATFIGAWAGAEGATIWDNWRN
jgi:hypothetical protein